MTAPSRWSAVHLAADRRAPFAGQRPRTAEEVDAAPCLSRRADFALACFVVALAAFVGVSW